MQASNVYGEAASVVVLEVSGEPDPPTQFRALGATHSAIQLRYGTGQSSKSEIDVVGL